MGKEDVSHGELLPSGSSHDSTLRVKALEVEAARSGYGAHILLDTVPHAGNFLLDRCF